MALFCSRYLTSHPFVTSVNSDVVRESALSGYYSLLDYAAVNWPCHAGCVFSSTSVADRDLRDEILCSVKLLIDSYQAVESQTDENCDSSLEETIRTAIERWKSGVRETSGFVAQISYIRSTIEAVDHVSLDDNRLSTFLALNGEIRFKCPRVWCLKFAEGFTDQEDRDRHVLEHQRPYTCSVEGCYARAIGYSSQQSLHAHVKRVHESAAEQAVRFRTRKPSSSIFDAATEGDLEFIQELHQQGKDLNCSQNVRGFITPFILAARYGHADVCEYLITQGLRPYTIVGPRARRTSPVTEAMKREDIELIRLMLQRTSPLDASHITDIVESLKMHGSDKVLEAILQELSPAAIKVHLQTILGQFCYSSILFKYRAEQILKNFLHQIIRHVFPGCYEPNRATPRRGTGEKDGEPALTELRDLIMDPTEHGLLLYRACRGRASQFVADVMLDFLRPMDLQAKDSQHRTALHIVSESYGSTELQWRLVRADAGAAANARDIDGNLPLHLAGRFGYQGMIPALLEYTKNPDDENNSGKTALELAVENGNASTVSLLVRSGRVDLARRTRQGSTMHELAAKHSYSRISLISALESWSNAAQEVEVPADGGSVTTDAL